MSSLLAPPNAPSKCISSCCAAGMRILPLAPLLPTLCKSSRAGGVFLQCRKVCDKLMKRIIQLLPYLSTHHPRSQHQVGRSRSRHSAESSAGADPQIGRKKSFLSPGGSCVAGPLTKPSTSQPVKPTALQRFSSTSPIRTTSHPPSSSARQNHNLRSASGGSLLT